MKKLTLIIVLLVLTIFGACNSRHRLDLYLNSGEFSKKLKLDQTYFYPNTVLTTPQQAEKVTAGDQNVIAATISTRWLMNKSNEFVFNENWKSILYLQIPEIKSNDSLSVINNSFLTLMEHYELIDKEKIFFPQDGFIKIDSLAKKMIYLTINGEYKNEADRTISLNGQFKVRAVK